MIILLFLIFSLCLFGASDNSLLIRLSPIAENIFVDYQDGKIDDSYLIYNIDSVEYVGCLVESYSKIDKSEFKKYSIIVGTEINNYYSLKVPLKNFNSFCQSNLFKYLQADEPVGLYLDSANNTANFTDADEFLRNSQFFKSDGVVVGVIDYGFQYNHHMFKNSSGNTRIKRAWIQGSQNNSVAPEGFNYGIEVLPQNFNISGFRSDDKENSHGSHVLGIAAGQKIPNTNIQGVATEADIILVTPIFNEDEYLSTGQSNLVDGVAYIFREASKLGKPCVINLSLGMQIGPHDGTALFDKMCVDLQNQDKFGRSLVTAAGNDGGTRMTLKLNPTLGQEEISSFFFLYDNFDQYIDIWGDSNESICLELGIFDGDLEWHEIEFCTNQLQKRDTAIVRNRDGAYRAIINLSDEEPINGKSRIFITLRNLSQEVTAASMRLKSSGGLKAFNSLFGGSTADEFLSLGVNGFSNGLYQYQIGEIGGNSTGFITVGSFNSKNRFVNSSNRVQSQDNTLFDISEFSSVGPNADDIVKPDITAAGSLVISALNNYNERENFDRHVYTHTGSDGVQSPIGADGGTSMSSPVVAGTVALMLRANRFLDQNQIKEILKQSVIEDQFTGSIPEIGSTTWGHGKLDAYRAVELAEQEANNIVTDPDILYTNPFDGFIKVKIEYFPSLKTNYYLFNSYGMILESGQLEEIGDDYIFNFDSSKLASGAYYLRLETDLFDKTLNLIKVFDSIGADYYKF